MDNVVENEIAPSALSKPGALSFGVMGVGIRLLPGRNRMCWCGGARPDIRNRLGAYIERSFPISEKPGRLPELFSFRELGQARQ